MIRLGKTLFPFGTGRHRRIFRAVASGGAARLLASATTLVSLPLALRYLGAERYGVWATIISIAVWVNLLDLGITNTLTNHISSAFALNDKASAARYFTNALALTTGLAAIAGAAFAFLLPHVNWIALLNVGPNVHAVEVRSTIAVAVGLMLLGLPCNLATRLLAGYQELHRSNFAMCGGALAGVAGLALGVMLRVTMPVLFVLSAGCLTLTNLVLLLATVAWSKSWLLPRPSLLDAGVMKELLSSGSSFFLIQVAGVIVLSSDNVIVSHYLGAAEVTPYSVTWRLVGLTALLQSLIFPALWPAYTEAYARGDYTWVRRTFAIVMKGTIMLNLVFAAVLVVFGRALIRLWAGPAAVPSNSLLIVMVLWSLISGCMSVESCLLAALNRVREQAVLSMLAAALNVALSIMLVRYIGSLGVIGGTVVSYLLVLVVPQSVIVRNLIKQDLMLPPKPLVALKAMPVSLAGGK